MKSNFEMIKKKKIGRKIRNFIIIGILVVSMLSVLGIMIFNYRAVYKNTKNDVLELSRSSTEIEAHNIDQFLAQHREVLLTAAEALDFYLSQGNYEGAKIEELLRNITESYNSSAYLSVDGVDFTGIYTSVDGVMYHGYRDRSELPEGYDPTQRQWYQEGFGGNGAVVFGEPHTYLFDPDRMVISVTKLLSDGSSVIGMNIMLEDIRAAAGDMGVSVFVNGAMRNYGFGFILTDTGHILASGDTYSTWDYADPSHPMNPIYKQILNCQNLALDGATHYHKIVLNGREGYLFSRKLDNGWYYATLTNMADIKNMVSDFSNVLFVGTIAVSAIALLYCILISTAYIKSEKMAKDLQGALNLASTDALTGLSNRTAYDIRIKELKKMIASSDRDSPFTVVMLDLNDLKYINDHQGHAEGDRYICNSADLVSSIFPCEIYRIGGDEFAMFLTGELYDGWELLYDELKRSIVEANMSLTPSADEPSIAIGLSVHKEGEVEDIEDLLRKADAEMYTNKLAIKQTRLENSEKGYEFDVKNILLDKQLLTSEMQKGLEEEQFEVWFQPQVNHANNGALIGAEALVRWRHPERGMISPAVFIPLFEYNGLIYELDKYVWKHACACVRRGLDEGMPQIPVSVNVSRYDMIQEDFFETITSIVEEQNIPYGLVHLEVTESAFADDSGKCAKVVNELIRRGFTIAIDDFGSGYSSLSLLRSVPAHIVKLDMRFFADGEDKTRNECIIESIIRMVKMLGMAVLAEGVEKVEQADLLHSLGCAYIQGYLYSKPLPYEEFYAYTKAAISEKINHDCAEAYVEKGNNTTETQNLFRNIIAGTAEVVVVFDNNTKQLLYANRAAEKYYGKRFDPINVTTCMEYCNHLERCRNCPAKGMKINEKREFSTTEKGRILKTLYAQMNWNGHDAVGYYQMDVTEQMKELAFSNALIHNMPGATVAFELGEDGKPKIRYFSDNARKTFEMAGLITETLIYEECRKVIYSDDRDRIRKAAYDLFFEKKPFRESFRIMLTSGSIMWIEALVNPVADRNGSYLFYGIYTDITERKNAQEHMDNVLQSIPAAITIYEITKNGANRIFISNTAQEVLMLADESHEKRAVGDLYNRVHEDDRQMVKDVTQECFKEGKPFCIQFRIVSEKGVLRWVQIDSKPMNAENKEGGFLFYSIYTDITEQKQSEY